MNNNEPLLERKKIKSRIHWRQHEDPNETFDEGGSYPLISQSRNSHRMDPGVTIFTMLVLAPGARSEFSRERRLCCLSTQVLFDGEGLEQAIRAKNVQKILGGVTEGTAINPRDGVGQPVWSGAGFPAALVALKVRAFGLRCRSFHSPFWQTAGRSSPAHRSLQPSPKERRIREIHTSNRPSEGLADQGRLIQRHRSAGRRKR